MALSIRLHRQGPGTPAALPVRGQNVQRRWFITLVVDVGNRVRNAVLGNHLLVLDSGTFESFLHVDIL